MKKGIVLFALGHHYYGEMAVNLAASIRQSNNEIPIALYYYGDGIITLNSEQLNLLDSVVQLDEKYLKRGDKTSFLKPKTFLDKISPFDETIYLDVDTLWFGQNTNIASQFDVLKDVDFTITNTGFSDLSTMQLPTNYVMWCDLNEVKEQYRLADGKYYSYNSEFIYFKKTEKVKDYFKKVREIFNKPLIKVNQFANDLPDEFAFSIASILTDCYPHKDNYRIIYWKRLDKAKKLEDIMNNYVGYSFGGNSIDEFVRNHYHILANAACKAVGIQHTHNIQSKRRFTLGREKF